MGFFLIHPWTVRVRRRRRILVHPLLLPAVVTVLLKQVLHALLPQQQLVLLLVLVLTRLRYLVPIVLATQHVLRNKLRRIRFLQQLTPRETLKPWVLLYLTQPSFCPQSIARFSLDHLNNYIWYLVYEVSPLFWPASGNLFTPNLNLLTEDLIADFPSIPTVIWSSPKHKLVGDNSNSIKINRKRMILSTHHLWSHISGSPASIWIIVRLHDPRDS